MQNPQPLAAPAVVGTHKSSPTTASYTSNEAQMGAVWIGADRFSWLRAESEQAYQSQLKIKVL